MKKILRKLRRLVFRLIQLVAGISVKVMRRLLPRGGGPAADVLKDIKGLDFSGRTVVITGSSRGIGLALAEAFLRQGAGVVINGRHEEVLAAALTRLRKISANVEAVRADVADEGGVQELFRRTKERFGRMDILINNAAVCGPQDRKIWDIPLKEWEETFRLNVTGPFLCSREAIRWARTGRHPVRIINVSSGIVGYGTPNLGVYNASKTALEGLSVSIAADCSGDGLVSIVNIHPRSVKTRLTEGFFPKTEYELMDEPQVIVPVFLYAASVPAGEIMGKTLSEPRFSAAPKAEVLLSHPVAAFPLLRMEPETFKQGTHERGEDNGAYMHLLQNPIGVYPSVQKAVQEFSADKQMYRYPDLRYARLREALAAHHGLDPRGFTFGTGSSELIVRAIRLFGGEKGKVIVTRPTWGSVVWPTILKAGLQPVEVPCLGAVRTKDIRHDLQGILRAVDDRTRLIYLVNPCNPTGSMAGRDELRDFLGRVPGHVVVLLDEAYIDYAEPEKRFDLASALKDISCKVIGLRTFSKFFALSGMRVGYAYGVPEMIDHLDRWDLIFNVTTAAQMAAVAALKDHKTQKVVYQNNHQERLRICQRLDDFKIDNMPSHTSFILFDCPLDRDRMRAALQKEGIFMPNVDNVVGGNFAVTAVGLPDHNQRILDFLERH